MPQNAAITAIRLVASVLSACGAVYTMCNLFPEKPWARPHVRACLVLLIASGDLLFSLSQLASVHYQLDYADIGVGPEREVACELISTSLHLPRALF